MRTCFHKSINNGSYFLTFHIKDLKANQTCLIEGKADSCFRIKRIGIITHQSGSCWCIKIIIHINFQDTLDMEVIYEEDESIIRYTVDSNPDTLIIPV